MSRRPAGAAHVDLCPNESSRGIVVSGAGIVAPPTPERPGDDPAIDACETWLNQRAEHDRLTMRWQDLETYLIREHDYFRLSGPMREDIPEAAEFEAADHRLAVLQTLNQDLLDVLPAISATTPHGLASKLAVAAACVRPDENEVAHALIQSILHDLQAMIRTK